MITQEYLKSLYLYDQLTGIFTRKAIRNNRHKIGETAGFSAKHGYIKIGIDGFDYAAHRLAWLYAYGAYPSMQIDHINHNPSDNRIENLRDVSQSDNQRNASKRTDNTSGVTGVRWHKATGKWNARIFLSKKDVSLGNYECINDAIIARKMAEYASGFHANHGGVNGRTITNPRFFMG